MIEIDRIFDVAIEKGASDIHLICGNRPMVRVIRNLEEVEDTDILDKEAMMEIYDYFVRGNIERDAIYRETKKIDTAAEYNGTRMRVNISSADEIPVFTLRLIKNQLPAFADLGVPDIVRRMTNQPQGLILVTGKTNSGKSTTLNVLIDEINQNQNKKILTLENPIEYKHESKKSIIVQKEVGIGKDSLCFSDGVKNALREDCDVLVIGEIRDRETMDAAIDMAESGHLVIGTVHTKSCAETIDRIINFYDISDQMSIKYILSSILKLVISQRLLRSMDEKLILVPEVMVVDNVMAGYIRKEKFSTSDIEDAIQINVDKGNIGIVNSIANLFVKGKISLEQAKGQIEEKNLEILNRTILQLRMQQ